MTQQKSKRNHWVPQSYLRPFAADERRKKIWTLGKTSGDPVLKPIDKVAVRFYLYAPGAEGQRDYSFEYKLSELEQLFGQPFWSSIATGFVDLSDMAVRKGIALLTTVMFLRNPTASEKTNAIYRTLRGVMMQEDDLPDFVEINGREYEVDKESWPAYRDASPDDLKRMWLSSVGQAGWLAELLLTMRWSIVFSEKPVFITTDNPVTILHPSLHFRGLKDPETSVIFPLSPTRLLQLDNRHAEPDGRYYPVAGRGEMQNMLLWRNAIEHMFTSRHPDEICNEIVASADGIT